MLITDRMKASKLKLNSDKTDVHVASRKADQEARIEPTLREVSGSTCEFSLDLVPQVLAAAKRAFAQLKQACRLHPFLELADVAIVTHATVAYHLL